MGGFDYILADIFRKEIESRLGKNTINKVEKRLFEKYGISITQSMNDFGKFDNVLKEVFGAGSKGIIRSILNSMCRFNPKEDLVLLQDHKITETILDMLGDKDYREILDMLIGKSLITYEILKKTKIPQASVYRKIDALVKAGLLVEDGKILPSETGRSAIRLTTLYRGLNMKIVKNKVTVEVMLSKNMLHKSSILCTVYSL